VMLLPRGVSIVRAGQRVFHVLSRRPSRPEFIGTRNKMMYEISPGRYHPRTQNLGRQFDGIPDGSQLKDNSI